MQTSAEALLSVINDILDFSKLAPGKLAIHFKPCDTAQLFTDIHHLLKPLAGAKDFPWTKHRGTRLS